MNAQEAYSKIVQENPGFYATEAIEFESFFMFQIRPLWVDKNETYFTGTVYPVVDKRNGKIKEYDIRTDPDAYLSAKQIPIKNVFDLKVN